MSCIFDDQQPLLNLDKKHLSHFLVTTDIPNEHDSIGILCHIEYNPLTSSFIHTNSIRFVDSLPKFLEFVINVLK